MPLEAVTHITDLNQTNPPGTDGLAQADDHIRNIKKALVTDFAAINGVVNATPAQLNLLNSIAALCVLANATNGAAQPTAIAAANDGEIFRRSGTALAFGKIDNSNPNAVIQYDIFLANTAGLAKVDTTFTDIPGLTGIALVTGALYSFEFFIEVTQTAGGGVKFKANLTNALQVDVILADEVSTTPSHNHFKGTITAGIAQSGAGTESIAIQVCGIIRANAVTGGTFSIQMAENAALGTTTLTNCFLRLKRIS